MKRYAITLPAFSLLLCLPLLAADHPSHAEPQHAAAHDHGIMVMADGVTMGSEVTPRFAVGAESVAVKSGPWSDPGTWTRPPAQGDRVQIPEGKTVTYDVHSKSKLDCIEVSGSLEFSDELDTELWATEIMVLPSGSLHIEPKDYRCEIVFPDGPLRASDTAQAGRGLLVFGEAVIEGKPLSNTFVRLAGDVPAGATQLKLREPVEWPAGAHILLPDTRDINPASYPRYYTYAPQWETRTIERVSGDTLTLDEPLTYAHYGPKDWDGKPTKGFDGQMLAPHVACLSRSVVLRSENPEGMRGHVQFFGEAKVSVRYAEFRELGRTRVGPMNDMTNHIGRYSFHCHHLFGPQGGIEGRQFIIEGNAIVGGKKWGITIHDSHYGLIRDNVVHHVDGAGIVGENGYERGNLFEHNFVCGVKGRGDVPPVFNGFGGVNEDIGDLGDGFWFAGPMNSVRNNVVANAQRSGYSVFPDDVPAVDRTHRLVQSPAKPGGPMQTFNLLQEPFNDFVGNECYGATTVAAYVWSVGDRSLFPPSDPKDFNTLRNTTVWHVIGAGIVFYNADSFVVDGWLHRGDPSMIHKTIDGGAWSDPSSGEAINHAGAFTRQSWVSNADIQGMKVGYVQRGRGVSDYAELNHSLVDARLGLAIVTYAQDPPDGSSDSVYNDILFGDSYSPGSLRAIQMQWLPPSEEEATTPETHTVVNFQRIAGLNLSLYYHEQAPGSKPPLVAEGQIPKGRWAPTQEVDGDNGQAARARGKAMGIDGLVFVDSHPDQPLVFANVLLERDQPVLYYTVIGDAEDPKVTIDFQGRRTKLAGRSGQMPLTAPAGLHPLSIRCDCGAELSKSVQFPVKK